MGHLCLTKESVASRNRKEGTMLGHPGSQLESRLKSTLGRRGNREKHGLRSQRSSRVRRCARHGLPNQMCALVVCTPLYAEQPHQHWHRLRLNLHRGVRQSRFACRVSWQCTQADLTRWRQRYYRAPTAVGALLEISCDLSTILLLLLA